MTAEKDSANTLFDFQKDLLVAEIAYIRERIANFDDLSFKIKGWSITLWTGVVAVGTTEKQPLVILASIPVILSFWLLDGYFKQYQRRSMTRMGWIEQFLYSRGHFEEAGLHKAFQSSDFGDFPIPDPIGSNTRKLNKEFEALYKERTQLQKTLTVSNVYYFYIIPAIAALLLAFLTGGV